MSNRCEEPERDGSTSMCIVARSGVESEATVSTGDESPVVELDVWDEGDIASGSSGKGAMTGEGEDE